MGFQQSEAARRLRHAVAAGDYAGAARHVEAFRQELDQVLHSAGPELAAALCAEAREVLELARRAVCADRARLAERLANVPRTRLYGGPRLRRAARTNFTA